MVVAVIVYIQEGQRRIPIQYASRVRGRRMYQGGATFLPLRVNQAGVIPIIFAVSILLFPTQIASYFATPPNAAPSLVNSIADGIVGFLKPTGDPVHRGLLPADDGLHLLLYSVHLQTRRDGRPITQERWLHTRHKTGAPTRDYLQKVVFRLEPRGRHLPGHHCRLADRVVEPS